MRHLFPVLIALGLLLTGCTYEGKVFVNNKTADNCDVEMFGESWELAPNTSAMHSYKKTRNIFQSEPTARIYIKSPHLLRDETRRVTLDGEVVVDVLADCGAICVANHSGSAVDSVFFRTIDVEDWGENLLEKPLANYGEQTWSLPEGVYQARISCASGPLYLTPTLSLGRGATLTVEYYGYTALLGDE